MFQWITLFKSFEHAAISQALEKDGLSFGLSVTRFSEAFLWNGAPNIGGVVHKSIANKPQRRFDIIDV